MSDLPSDIVQQFSNTASDLVVTLIHQPDSPVKQQPWVIWVGLERGDPRVQQESFIIGQAMTRGRAVRKAARQLSETLMTVVEVMTP